MGYSHELFNGSVLIRNQYTGEIPEKQSFTVNEIGIELMAAVTGKSKEFSCVISFNLKKNDILSKRLNQKCIRSFIFLIFLGFGWYPVSRDKTKFICVLQQNNSGNYSSFFHKNSSYISILYFKILFSTFSEFKFNQRFKASRISGRRDFY